MTGQKNTIAAALERTTRSLAAVAYEEAAAQARLLVCAALGLRSTAALGAAVLDEMPGEAQGRLDAAVQRRLSGEPVQYILGEWEFMGLPFHVSGAALIPRQDTETLCEHALAIIKKRGYSTLLDMCCGTGCIGISLAKLSGVKATLADISPGCLELSARNAQLNGVDASFVLSDMFGSIEGVFDIITINPPYLTAADMRTLQPELKHEPGQALFGGEDGLDFYRRIKEQYGNRLAPNGALMMECGIGQAQNIIEMFGRGQAVRDILGVERVIVI